MLTRKEELFVKPFQQRLYHQHKVKLKSATARVDTTPPQEWQHIVLKTKKYQKERERCTQILLNNGILWRHLSEIMSTRRVDNRWDYEQPKFFHRVNLFTKSNNKLTVDIEESSESGKVQTEVKNERCIACNPKLSIIKTNIPEERIPWDPPKKKLSKKLRSLSIHNDGGVKNTKNQVLNKSRQSDKKNTVSTKKIDNKLNINNNIMIETNNYLNYIEINEGSLDLVIKFPSGSKVSMVEGKTKRVLQPNNCQCTRCL
ncbi:unnamed protein product [Macrosiphum euphorbiae]|uniref:Uncharacterized protein n=1 Tax=Macrosiphum euphorbiae TaxID=13131 RepID=A0AAV0WQ27_9HEMI|nr:unnamed protein product [Macrosiphum euphorbiae]